MTIYAVNGKEPIAAWIPSLDTSGNGTTTLTDLVGSNDGTLTNMDAATDWVADTDAGGVRALDFDGVNDYVVAAVGRADYLTDPSFSFWIKLTGSQTLRGVFQVASVLNSTAPWVLLQRQDNTNLRLYLNAGYRINISYSVDTWMHLVFTCNAGLWTVYKDGVSIGTYAGLGALAATSTYFFNGFNGYALGRLDDARVWNVALDATDIAYLYNSGNGRGIVASGVVPSRRRRYAGGYGL